MNERPDLEARIFDEARRLPPSERADYLEQACAGNAALREQVEELLDAGENAETFLETPAPGVCRPAYFQQSSVPPGTSRLDSSHRVEAAGDCIGRYRLLEQIGEGGCGVVYLAEQMEPVRRKVALKVIKLGMDTKAVIARFDAERQALAMMNHPNIAKVLDAGATQSGRPYFVMELVSGTPITRHCDAKNLSTDARLRVFAQVCKAVQHAHQKGIIHRDIKPSNILLTDADGAPVPKIIDFGIAKATSGQLLTDLTVFTAIEQFIGTPAYMSPEQATLGGVDVDTRSDIYSLGVLLYELLTGETPFESRKLLQAGLDEMRRIVCEEEPLPPSTRLHTLSLEEQTTIARLRQSEPPRLLGAIRGDLDWIVMKALEKDRSRRYETANGLASDVERYLGNQPVLARPPGKAYLARKWVRRNKVAFVSAVAVLAALLLGVGISTWLFLQERQARRRANTAEQTQGQLRSQAQAALEGADLAQAVRLRDDGDPGQALVYLSRVLSSNPTNSAALVSMASLLESHTWMIPVAAATHSNWIRSVDFSPDGKCFLTASWDGTARVWDASSSLPATPPLSHNGPLDSAQFSRDGTEVVTASQDYTARVWNAKTGQPITPPLAHKDAIYDAQFSPDGTRVVTASRDNTARVWDARSGAAVTPPLAHQGWVVYAQFSPDGKQIVTASYDNTARVWNAEDGSAIGEPLKHGSWVSSAQFDASGSRIVTASYDGTALVWDAQTHRAITLPMTHQDRVRFAEFSPDGKEVVTASFDNTARLWDARSGKPLTPPLTHRAAVWFAQFSPDGKRVATASSDGTARIWEAASGRPLVESLRHGSSVYYVRFSPDGREILTASDDNTARVWESEHRAMLPLRLGHKSIVNSARFSGDGQKIVTASDDSTARVWDAASGRPLTDSLRHNGKVNSAEFSPNGRWVVTASADGTAQVWDAQTGQPVGDLMRHSGPIDSAEFNPDGERIVTASDDHTARIWDARTGKPLGTPLQHGNYVNDAVFSPDGARVLTSSSDGTAEIWDASSFQPFAGPLKHSRDVSSAGFSPDGTRVYTASYDHTARVWDARTGEPLTPPLRHGDAVLRGNFSPDGRKLVTASWDKTARIWDTQTGRQLTAPLQHADAVVCAQFSPDGRLIVTSSDDATLRVWDAENGQPLTDAFKQGAGVVSVRFSPDQIRIVSASRDGSACVWDLAPSAARCPAWLLRLAEAVSGQVLNKQSFLEQTPLNRTRTLAGIQEQLKHEPGGDPWAKWGLWFLAAPEQRAASPFVTGPASSHPEAKPGR